MKFRVVLRPVAQRDLHAAADWIAERSPQGAVRWFNGFLDAIQELETRPEQWAVAPEAAYLKVLLREFYYRTKSSVTRAVFYVAEDEVRIVRIRRPGQRPLQRDDLLP